VKKQENLVIELFTKQHIKFYKLFRDNVLKNSTIIHKLRSIWRYLMVDNEYKINLDRRFLKTHKKEFRQLLQLIGSKKAIVIDTIVNQIKTTDNTCITTVGKLAENSKVSNKTVVETLKELENGGLIARKTGAIMVNPRLLCYGKEPKIKQLEGIFYSEEWQKKKNTAKEKMSKEKR